MPDTVLSGQNTGEQSYSDGNADWFDSLPPELQQEPTIQPLRGKPIDHLAKMAVDTKKMVGGMVKIPGEGSGDEDWAKFYSKLGVPETKDSYDIKPPEGVEVSIDEALQESFKEVAHKAKLTPSQAQQLAEWKLTQDTTRIEQERLQAEETLKREWGAEYGAKFDHSVKVLKDLFPQDVVTHIENKYGNDPIFIKGLYALAEKMRDATFDSGRHDHIATGIGAKQQELQKIYESKEYNDSSDFNSHLRAREKANDLVNEIAKMEMELQSNTM